MPNRKPARNVFILGAGFSWRAGAPLVRDFLDRARELFDDPLVDFEDYERAHFEEVFKFKRDMAQAREKVEMDLDDIEKLFGLVEMSYRLGECSRETRDSTVYLIAKTLQLATHPPGRGGWTIRLILQRGFRGRIDLAARPDVFQPEYENPEPSYHADIYDYFASLIAGLFDDPSRQKTRVGTVITFNYDLVIDDALRRLGVGVDYHLPTDCFLESKMRTDANSCSVLKLHGSTNWGICPSCQRRGIILGEKFSGAPSEVRMQTCDRCPGRLFQPLLVPPSWDKSEYQEIMKPVWRRAVEELRLATRIFVIGYSAPEVDAFFQYLLTLGLSGNHSLFKFIVVDLVPASIPTATELGHLVPGCVENKYKQLLDRLFQKRRFSFHPEGFERWISTERALIELGQGEGLLHVAPQN
jgi:NAD-dependent SIR2 family protein deacetylase